MNKKTVSHCGSLAFSCLLFLLLPGTALAQQIAPAPLPPTYYTALNMQDGGTSEQAAEADVGKEDAEGDLDFLDKPLSEISRTQVTSPALSSDIKTVSRTTQPLARTAAAVYVVTNEMIRRCGARNIPEVLRTVPGVNVARINNSAWSITIRGLNGRFSGMLLAQIDGVPIYNPIHAGILWDRNYVMLEDVDRIEVIRGPGASVWGTNAVNGIINIVTKSSKDTQGVYLDAGGGNQHREFSDSRVGGRIGSDFTWRMYGMNMDDGLSGVTGQERAIDSQHFGQGGFRADWTPTRSDTITMQGDFYRGNTNQQGYVISPNEPSARTNINTTFLTRWCRQLDEDTDWALQVFYFNPYSHGQSSLNTNSQGQPSLNTSMFDLDYQYHLKRGRHDIVWGLGYRNNNEYLGTVGQGTHDSEQIPSFFVQDTLTLMEDRLFATFGSKFDFNSVTHYEYQPTGRLAWTPNERTSVWGAISRAVRTPALLDRNMGCYTSEDMLAYEAGIRRQPTDRFFWELAVFFNRYDNLIASSGGMQRVNAGKGDTYGFEWNATYEVTKRWHLTTWYAFLVEDIDWEPGYSSANIVMGGAPRNEYYFQSGWDLGNNVKFDLMWRYVDSLAAGVEDYIAGDIRLAWQPTNHLEISVVGQNLFNGEYYEFVQNVQCNPTKVVPGVYGMVSWRH